MKIIRDGQEFELTFREVMEAHQEYEFGCMVEDVKDAYEQSEYEVELSEKQIQEIASYALHRLNKNDNYFEAYWDSVNYTLEQYIDELDNKEEA